MLMMGLVLYLIPWFVMSVWVPIRIKKNDSSIREANALERLALSMWWPIWVCVWAVAWLVNRYDE